MRFPTDPTLHQTNTMRSTFIFLTSLTLAGAALNATAQGTLPNPDSILIAGDSLPHVLLLGTFHFDYPDLDAHVTAKDERVDVLSPERQKELLELLDVVMRFKPNKLCLETDGIWLMGKYREHQKDGKPMGRNEYYQIGFRVMDRAQLDTVYAVDAGSIVDELYMGKDSLTHRPWLDSLFEGWSYSDDSELSKRYSDWYTAEDKAKNENTLLELFLHMNDDRVLDRGYGVYLTGSFKTGGHRGADINAINWYDRNLRIFRNIQDITTSPDDRILVLFGAGHMGILKQLFDCSPEYQRVRLGELVEE